MNSAWQRVVAATTFFNSDNGQQGVTENYFGNTVQKGQYSEGI